MLRFRQTETERANCHYRKIYSPNRGPPACPSLFIHKEWMLKCPSVPEFSWPSTGADGIQSPGGTSTAVYLVASRSVNAQHRGWPASCEDAPACEHHEGDKW